MRRHFSFLVLCFLVPFFFFSCFVDDGEESGSGGNGGAGSSVSVTSLSFSSSSLEVLVGESSLVSLSYYPSNATDVSVVWSLSSQGVASISSGSPSGCVVTGVSAGTVILMASCQGVVSYCTVTVTDAGTDIDPYIVVPYVSLEVPRGGRRSVIASVYGGSVQDNQNFRWLSSSSCVSVESSGNTCVIEGLTPGSSRITVSNPKSLYPASFMVYVPDSDREVFYLTTSSNVVKSYVGSTVSFDVSCVGGSQSDLIYNSFTVSEGAENVTVTHSQGTFSVTGKAVGQSLIEVRNPKSSEPLYVRVVVSENKSYSYVEVDRDVMVLSGDLGTTVYAYVLGDASERSDVRSRFSFSVSDSSVIKVSQSGSYFYVNPLKDGKAILTISNEYADVAKDVLFVVSESELVSSVNYIALSEGILRLERGGSDVFVEATLVGGNDSDLNSFSYVVSDSSVITLEPLAGGVSYSRAAVSDAPVAKSGFTVIPRGVGTAIVTVTNPKSQTPAELSVRVYPRGMVTSLVSVTGPSFLSVVSGTPFAGSLEFSSPVSSSVTYSSSDSSVVTVSGTDSSFVLTSVSDGSAVVTADCSDFSHPYSFIVVSGSEEYVSSFRGFYPSASYCEVELGSASYIGLSPLPEGSGSSLDGTFSVVSSDPSVVFATVSGSTVIVAGKKAGVSDITVTSSAVPSYEVKVRVSVSDSSVTVEKPYSIDVPLFLGLVSGVPGELTASLSGAPSGADRDISWSLSSGGDAFRISGAGPGCLVTSSGVGTGVIEVSHPKAQYVRKVFLWSVLTAGELSSSVRLFADKYNYLLEPGEPELLSVVVTDSSKEGDVVWAVSDTDVLSVSPDGSRCLVTPLSSGNCTVTASLDGAAPVTFYVSVPQMNQTAPAEADLSSLPSVVELLVGDSVVIGSELSVSGSWESGCDFIDMKATERGCHVFARESGFGYLTFTSQASSSYKKIALRVYKDAREAEESYVMNVPKNVYVVREGGDFDVSLSFGTRSFPDAWVSGIVWESSDPAVLCVEGSGLSALVRPLMEGRAVVSVRSPNVVNEVSFEVVVLSQSRDAYVMSVERIRKVIRGSTDTLTYKIYSSVTGEEVSSYDEPELILSSGGEVVSASYAGDGIIRVRALSSGNESIVIRSSSYSCQASVLYASRESEEELSALHVFAPSRERFMISTGDEASLSLLTDGSDDSYFSSVTYRVSDLSVVSVTALEGGRNYMVKGLSDGTATITFSDGVSECEVYVSVSSYIEGSKDFSVESVIMAVRGKPYVSVVQGTVSSFSFDESFCDLVFDKQAQSFTVTARKSGMGEVRVLSGGSYKVIRVYSFDDDASLSGGSGWNIDGRYSYMTVGGTLRLRPVFVSSSLSLSSMGYELLDDGGVVSLENQGGVLFVRALNEGIARIRASSGDGDDLDLYFQVSEGNLSGYVDSDKVYLGTSVRDIFVDVSNDEGRVVRAWCEGGDLEAGEWKWTCDSPDLLTLNVSGSGFECVFVPKGRAGKCNVTLSSARASNLINFRVTVGVNYVDNGKTVRYVAPEKSTVPLVYGGPSVTVPVRLENVEGGSVSDITVGGESVYASVSSYVTDNVLYLTFVPRLCGQGRVSLSHPDADFVSYIDYFVSDDASVEVSYLTTTDNNVFVRPGEWKGISVRLMNADGYDASNYKWEASSDGSFVFLGEGSQVQVYGVSEGSGTVTVSHPYAANVLEIPVRVTEKAVSAKYITTQSNIIECEVSPVLDSFQVSLAGDPSASSKFSYVSSDTSVLSVIGSNDTCYYRGLRAGTAQITVSNSSDSSILDMTVTVVVTEASKGGSYITSDEPVLWMSPFGSSKTVSVSVGGASSVKDSLFQWYLYSQAPASSSGGEVLEVVSSGSRASFYPKSEGVAKVRASYPPLGLKMNFMVYVSSVGKMRFVDSSCEFTVGETFFAEVAVPSFSKNMEGFITYKSDDPSVCRVSGTSSVCCMSGIKAGVTVIRAYNSYDGTEDEISVRVVPEEEVEKPRIQVSKGCFIMNPRSPSEPVSALLIGSDVVEDDQENITWSVSGNKSVKVWPEKGPEAVISLVASQGTEITCGSAVVTLTHEKCGESYRKTLFVSVEEEDNFFTLDKLSMKLDANETDVVTASLVGASVKDYEEVFWSINGKVVHSDGTTEDIARCMTPQGQRCTVVGVNEGTCYVTAFYKGNIAQCELAVTGSRHFSVVNNYLTLYPGQEYDLQYSLKPAVYVPTFFSTDSGQSVQVISYSVDSAAQKVRIKALAEGQVTLTGIVSGIGTVNVSVNVVYDPFLKDKSKKGRRIFIPMYDKDTEEYDEFHNEGSAVFQCYPPDYFVTAELLGVDRDFADVSLVTDHSSFMDKADAGMGSVTVTARRELVGSNIRVKLTQWKDSACTVSTGITLEYDIEAYYVKADGVTRDYGYRLYFKKGFGDWSGSTGLREGGELLVINGQDGSSGKVNYTSDNPLLLGEGETHYFVFKPQHEGQYFENLSIDVRRGFNPAIGMRWDEGQSKEVEARIDLTVQDFDSKEGVYVSVINTGDCDVGWDCMYDPDTRRLSVPSDGKSSEKFYGRFGYKKVYLDGYLLDIERGFDGRICTYWGGDNDILGVWSYTGAPIYDNSYWHFSDLPLDTYTNYLWFLETEGWCARFRPWNHTDKMRVKSCKIYMRNNDVRIESQTHPYSDIDSDDSWTTEDLFPIVAENEYYLTDCVSEKDPEYIYLDGGHSYYPRYSGRYDMTYEDNYDFSAEFNDGGNIYFDYTPEKGPYDKYDYSIYERNFDFGKVVKSGNNYLYDFYIGACANPHSDGFKRRYDSSYYSWEGWDNLYSNYTFINNIDDWISGYKEHNKDIYVGSFNYTYEDCFWINSKNTNHPRYDFRGVMWADSGSKWRSYGWVRTDPSGHFLEGGYRDCIVTRSSSYRIVDRNLRDKMNASDSFHSGGNLSGSYSLGMWKNHEMMSRDYGRSYPNKNYDPLNSSDNGCIIRVSFRTEDGQNIEKEIPVRLNIYDAYRHLHSDGDITNPKFMTWEE